VAVRSDRGSLLPPASVKFSYQKHMYIYTRLHGILSYTKVLCIQTYGWAAFIYIFFYWRTFREITLFRIQVLNCCYTDIFSFTVYLRLVTAVVWVAYLLSAIQFNSFQLIKQDKKSKIFPLQARCGPEGG